MGKPRLTIAANFAYSDRDLESLSNVLEPIFEVELKRFEEFQKEILGPIVLFIFYGISSGFFRAIGKNLWNVMKERIASIVAKTRESGISDLEFALETDKRKIRFRLHSSDSKAIEKAIDQFPETLRYAEENGREIDYYGYDSEKEKWTH